MLMSDNINDIQIQTTLVPSAPPLSLDNEIYSSSDIESFYLTNTNEEIDEEIDKEIDEEIDEELEEEINEKVNEEIEIKEDIYNISKIVKYLVGVDTLIQLLNFYITYLIFNRLFLMFIIIIPFIYIGFSGTINYKKYRILSYILYLILMSIYFLFLVIYTKIYYILILFFIELYLLSYVFKLYNYLSNACDHIIINLQEGWSLDNIGIFY